MPFNKLLRELSLDPEQVRIITTAYEAALELIGVKRRSDIPEGNVVSALNEIVARKIIEIVRTEGMSDPAHICARALRELGLEPQR